MLYGFDCPDRESATAALIVYAVWRSRDRARFRIDPDVWARVERFVKSAAKRSTTIPRFIEVLKPRLACGSLAPKAMAVAMTGYPPFAETEEGEWVRLAPPGERQFLTQVLGQVNHRAVVDLLYRETAYIILMVRDRLERERPREAGIDRILDQLDHEEGEAVGE